MARSCRAHCGRINEPVYVSEARHTSPGRPLKVRNQHLSVFAPALAWTTVRTPSSTLSSPPSSLFSFTHTYTHTHPSGNWTLGVVDLRPATTPGTGGSPDPRVRSPRSGLGNRRCWQSEKHQWSNLKLRFNFPPGSPGPVVKPSEIRVMSQMGARMTRYRLVVCNNLK